MRDPQEADPGSGEPGSRMGDGVKLGAEGRDLAVSEEKEKLGKAVV